MSAPLRDIALLSPRRRALFARLARERGFVRAPAVRAPPGQTRFPLTGAERSIWLAQRLAPGSTIYHETSAIELSGPLDPGALARALAALVARHPTLRTTFAIEDGGPVQIVGPPWTPELSRAEVASPGERERTMEAFAALSFDLERGPLARFLLQREGDDEHLLVLVLHHLVTDGASSAVIFGDLITLYAAFATGEEPGPLAPALTPGELAIEEEAADPAILDAHLAYFRARLQGAERARLPADRAFALAEPARAGTSTQALDLPASEALRALARTCGVTPFIVLLAAFAVAIAQRTGRTDLVIGAPFARRERPELRASVGCFLVTLALRVVLDEARSFRDVLRICREAGLGAFAHRDVPLDRLAQALGRNFEIDFLLNVLPPPPAPRTAAGVAFTLLRRPIEAPKADVTLYARGARAGALDLTLVHDARRFDGERARELLDRAVDLLTSAASDPDVSIAPSTLVDLAPLALPKVDGGASVLHAIADALRQRSDRPAIFEGDTIWTFADLDRASDALARRLLALGVSPGDRVALIAGRHAALVAAILGVLRTGAAFVLLDPAYPAARLTACVHQARPHRILAVGEARVPGIALDLALPLDLQGLLALGAGLPDLPRPRILPDDEAYLAFTSGSTGEPKGIRGAHRPLAHFVRWAIETFAVGPDDRVSMLSGLSHDPLLRDVLLPLAAGAAIVVPDLPHLLDPGALADWLATTGVTIAHLTPAMASLLGAVCEEGKGGLRVIAGPALPRLRIALLGGEIVSPGAAEQLQAIAPAALVASVYGATETPQIMAMHVFTASDSSRARLPIGRGIDGAELLILDRHGRAALPGEVGEIVLRTPFLALGYLRPEDGADRFFDLAGSRAYRTGDLGRRLGGGEGEVEILGRADAQVKIRAHRVELGAVERALVSHPGLLSALVAARPDASGEPRLVAYLVPRAAPPERISLEAHLRSTLIDAELPSAYVMLDRLPLTPNGKLDRSALPEPALPALSGERPRTQLEETLGAIWSRVLGVPAIGLDDDFFALGGHSLRAVQMLSRLRDATSIELPLRAVFDAPTVRALALLAEPVRASGAEQGARSLRPSLTSGELDAWFLDEVDPDHDLLRASFVARVEAALDAPTVQLRLTRLLQERPELGARFRLEGDQPLRAPGRGELLLPVSAISAERDLAGLIEEERRPRFDLGAGPLLRARLVLFDGKAHALVVTVHAIALGAWSTAALARVLAGKTA